MPDFENLRLIDNQEENTWWRYKKEKENLESLEKEKV